MTSTRGIIVSDMRSTSVALPTVSTPEDNVETAFGSVKLITDATSNEAFQEAMSETERGPEVSCRINKQGS